MNRLHNTVLEKTIKQAKEGDAQAFKIVFDGLSDRLFAYAVSHTKNRDDALDIVQETFIDLWNALSKLEYQSDEAFYGFVFIILKRKLYKHYKLCGKTISIEEINIPTDEITLAEDYRHLHKHINTLTPRYQKLLKLRYWAGLPFKEIANVFNIKETTAKVWHHRAIRKLKSNVKKYDI